MKAGYYIKVEDLFWTGRYWRGDLVLTKHASKAARISARSVADELLNEVQGIRPTATLITHLMGRADQLRMGKPS